MSTRPLTLHPGLAPVASVANERHAHLATDPDPHVRSTVAVHPNLAQPLRRTLIADESGVVRRTIATRHDLTEDEQQQLLADPDEAVLASLVRNTAVSVEILHALMRSSSQRVRGSLAINDGVPFEWRLQQTPNLSTAQVSTLVRDPRTPPAKLVEFMTHKDLIARCLQQCRQREPPLELLPVRVLKPICQVRIPEDLDVWRNVSLGIAAGMTGNPALFLALLPNGDGTVGDLQELVVSATKAPERTGTGPDDREQ